MLQGKVILVTGSSSGIGLAIARAAQAEGATVVLHGIEAEALAQAAVDLGGVASVLADVTAPEAAATIIDAVLRSHGRIDGLVNNAASLARTTLEQADEAAFDAIFAANARAPLLLCREAVRAFRAQGGGGTIVNIGSVNALCGQGNLVVYSMSKAALMTMTRNLGDSLSAERIRVNQLNVGWTLTETERAIQRREGQPDDWAEHIPPAFAPTGRILRPEEVAQHAVFWLSDRSAPVTGQVYEVEQYPLVGRNKINTR
ncbi:SDR family oxidoreductase [Inquilinus sp.]|jgi:NAD(P)-dependent dehydrogenase (short-subunit alcohol dehydrogenase family)|uniref:SDR family oxidoreductase n=1 Tax=Inquilinus sp. TaxID=1932117 RepID=UPI00378460C7